MSEGIRTPDLQGHNLALSPTELHPPHADEFTSRPRSVNSETFRDPVGRLYSAAMKVLDIIESRPRTLSLEFYPPKDEKGARQLFRSLDRLCPLQPSFVTMTYGAGGSTRNLTVELVRQIHREYDVEAVCHLTCVGAKRDQLREVYGQHKCDINLIISHAQRDESGNYPNDCLGHDDGTPVDNIEDLDTVVGWLAEPVSVRPHGFAISETQFVVFILNASRRLFSDRFFTSSFRPEFYTSLGHQWVMNNGPEVMMEKGEPNGHAQEVSPMKRILQRTLPELTEELEHVVNV